MATVQQILDEKGHTILSVDPESSVFDAIQEMTNNDVGALLVVENNRLLGLFSERDYTRNVILQGKSSPKTPVRDIMTSPVMTARPQQTVSECMAVMTEKRVRHLPVLDDGNLIGIISIGDLVKSIIADQQFTIEQLERYVYSVPRRH